MLKKINSMISELKSIGLSEKESKAYLALVKNGTSQISLVAKKSDLNRGTTYVILHQLLSKGLVTKSIKNNIQFFSALEPKNLRSFLEKQKNEINNQISSVESIINSLNSLSSSIGKIPKVRFFEGIQGCQIAMEETLKSDQKKLYSFLSIDEVANFVGKEFFEEYTNKRIKNKVSLKAIRNKLSDEIAFKNNPYAKKYITNKKHNREVRYVKNDVVFPMSIYLYDNNVLGLSSKQEGYAVIIESKDFSSILKTIFLNLWESL